jgi:hypothetical protein
MVSAMPGFLQGSFGETGAGSPAANGLTFPAARRAPDRKCLLFPSSLMPRTHRTRRRRIALSRKSPGSLPFLETADSLIKNRSFKKQY